MIRVVIGMMGMVVVIGVIKYRDGGGGNGVITYRDGGDGGEEMIKGGDGGDKRWWWGCSIGDMVIRYCGVEVGLWGRLVTILMVLVEG